MLKLCLVVVALVLQGGRGQDDEEPYRGKLIGSFHSYHHQVSGMVYAVDEWTLQLAEFNYDGTGDDAFLWAGEGGRPGPHGYIVPDEHGSEVDDDDDEDEDVSLRAVYNENLEEESSASSLYEGSDVEEEEDEDGEDEDGENDVSHNNKTQDGEENADGEEESTRGKKRKHEDEEEN